MLNKEENQIRLNKRISQLNLGGSKIIAFDFDELVVPIHLTREVTKAVSSKPDISKLNKLGSCSFEGILYLNSLLNGLNFEEYKRIRDKTTKETPWRKGFKELLQKLMKNYSVIFISSGMKDIAEAKLNEIGFKSSDIIGGEFEVSNGEISGTDLVISDETKGYIVKKLREKSKVIGIGHSRGDAFMLQESDISIGFNPDVLDLAEYEVQTPEEILKIAKNA